MPVPAASTAMDSTPAGESGRRSRTPLLVGVLAAAALAVALIGLVLASRRSADDDSTTTVTTPVSSGPAPTSEITQATAVTTSPAAPATTVASTIADSTTLTSAAPPPATDPPVTQPPATDPPVTQPPATDPPATDPPATDPPATDPPVTQPPATDPPATDPPATTEPATTQPATTDPPPTTGATPVTPASNVLDDPLPSGVRSAEVQASLVRAQGLANALAAGDWDAARTFSSSLGGLSDAQLENGYGGLDRSTLLLVDAERQQGDDDLLVALIANERAGAQTTIYCVESTVSATGDVDQRTATVLDRFSGTLSLEDVRQDPAVTDLIRQQCSLSS